MSDFASLPGAPPADDAAAWAPGGAPSPSSAPFAGTNGRGVDVDQLNDAQRWALKQAIRSGDEAQYQAFEAMLASPNTGASQPPSDAQPGSDSGAAASPAGGAPVPPETAEFNAKLEEHGLGPEAFDHIVPDFDKFHDRLMAMNAEDAAATVLAGEEEVIRAHYRGSEAAMQAGVADIRAAAELLNLDIQAINDSGILADPVSHWRVLCLARFVLQNRKL